MVVEKCDQKKFLFVTEENHLHQTVVEQEDEGSPKLEQVDAGPLEPEQAETGLGPEQKQMLP